MDLELEACNPEVQYEQGMGLYTYISSNPMGRVDPSGCFDFTIAGLLGTTTSGTQLQIENGVRSGLAYGIILAALGRVAAQMDWGVGGGITSEGFAQFVDGVDAVMSGQYAFGEMLMVSAEAAAFSVCYMSQAEAVKKALSYGPVIARHWVKIATGGPDHRSKDHWKREVNSWLDKIEQLTSRMKGRTGEQWTQWLRTAREGLDVLLRGGGSNAPPPMPG